MIHNNAKGKQSLKELGWVVHEPGRLEVWDGLSGWFASYLDEHPQLREDVREADQYRKALKELEA